LPPYYRQVIFQGEEKEVLRLTEGFVEMQRQNRLAKSVEIVGPIPRKDKEAALLLTAELAEADRLIEIVAEVNRRRSVAKKKALTLRVDPYQIS
jgi:primosomal protein N'